MPHAAAPSRSVCHKSAKSHRHAPNAPRVTCVATLYYAQLVGVKSHCIRFRSSRFALAGAALIVPSLATAEIVVETYTSRAAFEGRLGVVGTVNFDDIATVGDTPSDFAADRYLASHGLTVTGAGGSQYASRTFEYAADFPAPSAPNTYAPGPVGGDTTATLVDFFSASLAPARVAGFGLDFVDVDYFSDLSGLTIFNDVSVALASQFVPVASNGSIQFLGFVTVDRLTNLPVSIIASARFTTGGGWPSTNSLDGVSVDNLSFTTPTAIPEPSVYASLAGLTALGLAVHTTGRRRR